MIEAVPPGLPPPSPQDPSAEPPGSASPAHTSALADALRRLAACAARPAERSSLLRTIVEQAAALAGADAALALRDGGDLRVAGGSGSLAWLEGERLPLAGSFTGAALDGARSAADLQRQPEAHPLELELGAGPGLALPLGDRAGVLLLKRAAGEPALGADVAAALEALGEVAAGLLVGAAAYDRRRATRTAAPAAEGLPRLLETLGMACFRVDVASGVMRWPLGSAALPDRMAAECEVHDWLRRVHPDDRERTVRALTGPGDGADAAGVRLLAPGGDERPFRLTVQPDGSGSRVGLLRREDLPGIAAADLIRAIRHEINNPLAVVSGHSQLLSRDPAIQSAEHLEAAVRQIADAAERIGDLTRRLEVAGAHPERLSLTPEGGLGIASASP